MIKNKHYFEKSGFQNICPDNVFDGLSLTLNNDYSLILMDLTLQLQAGKEVLKIIFREMLYVAIEKAYYCCNLINDFFDISLMDSNAYTPVYEKTDITGFICEQILAIHPVFKEKI